MRGWMKDWGQFVVLLVALGGFYGFIRSDMWTMEERLGARMQAMEERLEARMQAMEERLGARIDANRDNIVANREAIVENGKAIARLEVRTQRVEDDVTWLRNNR